MKKWAKRENVFCWRLYDKDIPEIPLSVDLYCAVKSAGSKVPMSLKDGGVNQYTKSENIFFAEDNPKADRYLNICLYKRPYEKDEAEEALWFKAMTAAASQALGIPQSNIFLKLRQKQKGNNQYEKMDKKGERLIVKEGSCFFYINLSDYIDTGLFLDHRPLRLEIGKTASGKRVLNLFCYTGAFSIHALKGGAAQVDSVDLSKTYLQWAFDNACLNGFSGNGKHQYVNADVIEFLNSALHKKSKWDIIICDPPTFSNSKQTETVFDINKDWFSLCCLCLNVLAENGVLYFSTNSSKLKFDAEKLSDFFKDSILISELTQKSIPEDFRNKKIHRLWRITNPK